MGVFGKRKFNFLVIGSDGMLGSDLFASLSADSAKAESDVGLVHGAGRDAISEGRFWERHAFGAFLDGRPRYDWVVNCAAMTDTRRAETTRAGAEESWRLNALMPGYMAEGCRFRGARFVHVSTDYVFSERSASYAETAAELGFSPEDEAFPVNAYGTHKLFGERAVLDEYRKNPSECAVLRTSWLYGAAGKKSFVHRFVRNLAAADEPMEMTSDEVSVPTSTSYLVACIMRAVRDPSRRGLAHAVPASAGGKWPSRLDFAERIRSELVSQGFAAAESPTALRPLTGVPRDGLWPKFSAMRGSFGELGLSWQDCLADFIRREGAAIAAG